jgi:hypothetical protein
MEDGMFGRVLLRTHIGDVFSLALYETPDLVCRGSICRAVSRASGGGRREAPVVAVEGVRWLLNRTPSHDSAETAGEGKDQQMRDVALLILLAVTGVVIIIAYPRWGGLIAATTLGLGIALVILSMVF